MINSSDLKSGVTFFFEGSPYRVTKYNHIKVGRGGAIVRVTVRNLESGAVEEKTMSSNVKVEDISTVKRQLQYLYNDGSTASFMDQTSFEQIEIPLSVIADELPYLKEGELATIMFWDDKPLSIDIPPKITLTVKETNPGVKGNSATNVYKPAILENGLEVKVPLFIKVGEKVRVDTRTGEYVERAQA